MAQLGPVWDGLPAPAARPIGAGFVGLPRTLGDGARSLDPSAISLRAGCQPGWRRASTA